jgi:hypothetical protein
MHTVVGIAIVQGGSTCAICDDAILSVPVCMIGCILDKYIREWCFQETDIIENDVSENEIVQQL